MHKDYQNKNLVVVTVSSEERSDIQKFAAEHPYSFISTYLKEPVAPGASFIKDLELQPVTFVIDREGTIRDVMIGGHEYDVFVSAASKYL